MDRDEPLPQQNVPLTWPMLLRLATLGLAFGIAAGMAAERIGRTPAMPPTLRHQGNAAIGGPFALIAHTGKPITDRDFRGKPLLVTFGYSRDETATPATLQVLSQALQGLGPHADRVAALFVTLDPAHDTVSNILNLIRKYDHHIIGATGSPEAIAALAKAYRLPLTRIPDNNAAPHAAIEFEPLIYLMNSDGAYVAHWTHASTANELMMMIDHAIGRS